MRPIVSQYPGKCKTCKQPYNPGDTVYWQKGIRGAIHASCYQRGASPDTHTATPDARPVASKFALGNRSENENHSVFSIDWADLKAMFEKVISTRTADNTGLRSGNSDLVAKYLGIAHYFNQSFTGFTREDISDWLTNGYEIPGLQFDNPPVPIREKRRFQYLEEGEEFHVDILYEGSDNYFSDWTKREVIPGLSVEIEIGFLGSVKAGVTRDYCDFICRALYALETSGVDCEITISNTVNELWRGNGKATTRIVVKRENEATDFRSWSAMLSPATYRGYTFAAKTLHAESANRQCSSGQGSSIFRNWRVEFDKARRVMVISCNAREDYYFPRESMESQLKAALKEIH